MCCISFVIGRFVQTVFLLERQMSTIDKLYSGGYWVPLRRASMDYKNSTAVGCASRWKSTGAISCLCIFYRQCITRKYFILKIKVKVMEYNIRIGPVWWRIPISIKVMPEHFSWHWKYRSKSWCTTFAVVSFNGKWQTSYLTAMILFAFFQPILVKIRRRISKCIKVIMRIFAQAHTVWDILLFEPLNWENWGQGHVVKNGPYPIW